MTASGAAIETLLPPHQKPKGDAPDYLSMHLPDGRWALRVMVPLADAGYFEGVRVVPEWQRRQVRDSALSAALLAALAALLCGAAIYPVVLHLSRENEQKAREVLDSHIAMMEALGRAIAKRDSDTGAHNYRVAWTAARIAERMGFRSGAMQALIAGSFLHDVGKIGIPDAILLKPGKLDAEEFAIMRTHVAQGEDIVHGMGWLDGAHAVVAGHHEKWGRQRLPAPSGRRGHSAGGAHLRGGRRLRCALLAAPVQGAALLRGGDGNPRTRQRQPFRPGGDRGLPRTGGGYPRTNWRTAARASCGAC